MWRIVKSLSHSRDVIVKDCGDVQYQIIYKEPLDEFLIGEWEAWRIECGLVGIEICSSEKLENCIKKCNRDIKCQIE